MNNKSDMHPVYRNLHTIHRQKGVNPNMQKALLIAEKPSLKDKIEKVYEAHRTEIPYEITFTAMAGHLVTLKEPQEMDESLKVWSWDTLPILPGNYGGWQYKLIKEKKSGNYLTSQERFKRIKEEYESEDYDIIIHAGDPDREGEFLVWLLLRVLKVNTPVMRFWTNELTDTSIIHALNNLRDEKTDVQLANLLRSAYVRSHEDWLFGMNLSRASSLKMNGRVAVGRVKTAIQAIVCKREIEIENFRPSTCYGIRSIYEEGFDGTMFELIQKKDEGGNEEDDETSGIIYYKEKSEAEEMIRSLPSTGKVISFEAKRTETNAPKLFKLSTAQIAAGKLGYSSSETLSIIQSLYERSYMSYPRTDCEYIASAEDLPGSLEACRCIPDLVPFIDKIDGSAIARVRKTKKWVNDEKLKESGHSALIPTNVKPDFSSLSPKEQDIYRLICRQYVAIFLPALIQNKTRMICDIGGQLFKSTGKTLVSKGYTEIFGTKFTDSVIPEHHDGDILNIQKFMVNEKVTTRPKRFTDSDLIEVCENPMKYFEDKNVKELAKSLAKRGKKPEIGTPATRSEIIKALITKDKYLGITTEKKTQYIVPTEIGMAIYLNLRNCSLCQFDTTIKMEDRLKMIEFGELSPAEMETEVENDVLRLLTEIKETEMKQFKKKEYPVICKCPKCDGNILSGPKSFFCSEYKNGCKAGGFKTVCDSILSDPEIKELMEGKEITKTLKKGTLKWNQKLKYNMDTLKLEFVREEAAESSYVCPSCHKKLMEDSRALTCTCGAKFWKMAGGIVFSPEQVKRLFTEGNTGLVKGLTAKSGKHFDAEFVFTDDKKGITFQFPKAKVSSYICPKCGSHMQEDGRSIKCECGFTFWKVVCGKELNEKQIERFFRKGSTGVVKGMKSKKGKKFEAEIVLKAAKDGVEFRFG